MKDTGLLPWVLVLIALLVEYCSANVEAMGSNPIEAPKFFGHLLFAIAQIAITTVISYLHLNMYSKFNLLRSFHCLSNDRLGTVVQIQVFCPCAPQSEELKGTSGLL